MARFSFAAIAFVALTALASGDALLTNPLKRVKMIKTNR